MRGNSDRVILAAVSARYAGCESEHGGSRSGIRFWKVHAQERAWSALPFGISFDARMRLAYVNRMRMRKQFEQSASCAIPIGEILSEEAHNIVDARRHPVLDSEITHEPEDPPMLVGHGDVAIERSYRFLLFVFSTAVIFLFHHAAPDTAFQMI